MKIFSASGRAWGAAPPSVNLGPLISRKLLEIESWNFTNIYTVSQKSSHL